jgi:hypothetical protein
MKFPLSRVGDLEIFAALSPFSDSSLGASLMLAALAPSSLPRTDEIRRLVHALREPVGAFVIHVSMIEDERLSDDVREHVAAMLSSVERMVGALADITSRFGLELGDATPLSMIASEDRRASGAARAADQRRPSRRS